MRVVGLIGLLVFLAGIHLIWQARGEVLYWLEAFFRIFKVEVTRRNLASDVPVGESVGFQRPPRPHGALRLVTGFGLMFLGQVLFFLDLAL